MSQISIVTILAVVIFFLATVFKTFKLAKFLYIIICLNLITEILSLMSNLFEMGLIVRIYNLYIPIQFILWFSILLKFSRFLKLPIILFSLILTVLAYFLVSEQLIYYDIFLYGSLLYFVIYFVIHYKILESENIEYFTGNEFIKLSAPLAFFFAFSFIFCFRESRLLFEKIAGRTLYNILQNGGNFIYYSLLIVYIIRSYKEYKLSKTIAIHD